MEKTKPWIYYSCATINTHYDAEGKIKFVKYSALSSGLPNPTERKEMREQMRKLYFKTA